jgi:periplasmic divalent cation tolerance protein
VHSYENPEVIALPIVAGSRVYLDWIDAQTRL